MLTTKVGRRALGIFGIFLVLAFASSSVASVSAQTAAPKTSTRISADHEMYIYKTTLGVPDLPWFRSTWIIGSSWIDQAARRYYLSDPQNKRIDVIDLVKHEYTTPITGAFTGWSTSKGGVTRLGPSGLVGSNGKLYVGNGDGSLKVFDAQTGQLLGEVSTGGREGVGKLAYDSEDQVLLVVHSDDPVPFAQLVSVGDPRHPQLLGSPVPFAGARPETPIWDDASHRFLLSVEMDGRGEIAALSPTAQGLTPAFKLTLPCSPGGLALGPNAQLLVGCAHGHPLQIDESTGVLIASFPQVPGSVDEISFDAGDGCFYIAAASPDDPVVGVIDVVGTKHWEWITNISTAPGAHDVAVDFSKHAVYIPENGLSRDGYAYQGIAAFGKNWYY